MFVLSLAVALPARGQQPLEGRFKDLKNSTFLFQLANSTCQTGFVKDVSPGKVIIGWQGKAGTVLKSDDVVRVTLGDGSVIYSAQSSWSDVKNVHLYAHEKLVITLRTGERVEAKTAKVNDAGVSISASANQRFIPFTEVVSVDYLEQKPISDDEEHFREETPILWMLSPRAMAQAMNLREKLHVRLYDVTRTQDAGADMCRPQYHEKPLIP